MDQPGTSQKLSQTCPPIGCGVAPRMHHRARPSVHFRHPPAPAGLGRLGFPGRAPAGFENVLSKSFKLRVGVCWGPAEIAIPLNRSGMWRFLLDPNPELERFRKHIFKASGRPPCPGRRVPGGGGNAPRAVPRGSATSGSWETRSRVRGCVARCVKIMDMLSWWASFLTYLTLCITQRLQSKLCFMNSIDAVGPQP